MASKKIQGSGLNENKNAFAYEADPFKHVKSIAGSWKDPKRIHETVPIVGTILAGKRMKREAERTRDLQRMQASRLGQADVMNFYNNERQRLSGDNSAFSLSNIQ